MTTAVLVIDDDVVTHKIFRRTLEPKGFEVETVADSDTGLALAAEDRFGVIFLDLRLRGESGVDTLKKLSERRTRALVYVITGYYDAYREELQRLAREGIDFELMIKPLGMDQIMSVCEAVCETHRAG